MGKGIEDGVMLVSEGGIVGLGVADRIGEIVDTGPLYILDLSIELWIVRAEFILSMVECKGKLPLE